MEEKMEACNKDKEAELGFPVLIAVRRKFRPDDPFFAAGNIERELLAKQVALDLTEDERYQLQAMEDAGYTVYCPIVGCDARLNCLEEFENHYHDRHTASCSVCSRVYPTSRLLSIHVSEAHDSFFQAKVARGFPMYECLVEGCGVKLKSDISRQHHLVDKHKFPTSFEFSKKAKPSKHQRQKQHASRREDKKGSGMDVDERTAENPSHKHRTQEWLGMEVDGEVDKLASAVSKISTSDSMPSSISFGHRHARGFTFLPRTVRKNAKQVSQSDAKV